MKRKFILICLAILTGCSLGDHGSTDLGLGQAIEEILVEEENVPYADLDFYQAAGQALNKRQKAFKENDIRRMSDYEYINFIKDLNNQELADLEDYEYCEIEDSKLKLKISEYLRALKDMNAYLEYEYSQAQNLDRFSFISARRQGLVQYFLKNDAYKNQVSEEFLNDSTSLGRDPEKTNEKQKQIEALVDELNRVEFEVEADDYGYFSYSFVVENKFESELENLNLIIHLLDTEGVIIYSYNQYFAKLRPGEKYRVKFQSLEEADDIEVIVD